MPVISCSCHSISISNRFSEYTANSTAHFEELFISATFPTPVIEAALQATDSAVFPVAAKTSIMPLEPEDYTYEFASSGNNTVYNLTLENFNEELYSFAVWGRVFATDGQEADPPVQDSASRSAMSGILLVALLGVVGLGRY